MCCSRGGWTDGCNLMTMPRNRRVYIIYRYTIGYERSKAVMLHYYNRIERWRKKINEGGYGAFSNMGTSPCSHGEKRQVHKDLLQEVQRFLTRIRDFCLDSPFGLFFFNYPLDKPTPTHSASSFPRSR